MISAHLPHEAYELAAEHQLGEPIREYRAKPMTLKALGYLFIILLTLYMLIPLIQRGFHFETMDLIPYGITLFCIVILLLTMFIVSRRSQKVRVYIFTDGFINRDRHASNIIRWEEIERVAPVGDNSRCVVYLENDTSIKINTNIQELSLLSREIEVKTQLAKNPEQRRDLERQFEELQHAHKEREDSSAGRYQEQLSFFKLKDPEETYRLGAEYRLGGLLVAYRVTLRHMLFPTSENSEDTVFTLVFIGVCLLFIADGILHGNTFWATSCSILLVVVLCIWPRWAAKNIRLYCYEDGLLYIHPGAIDVIHWAEVDKAVYAHRHDIFSARWTIYLKNGDKIELNRYLYQRESIKRLLLDKVPVEETHPDTKKKSKDTYIDIGHIAD